MKELTITQQKQIDMYTSMYQKGDITAQQFEENFNLILHPQSKPKEYNITLDTRATAFSLKFCYEQITADDTVEIPLEEQAQLLRKYLTNISRRELPFYYHAIVHDKDYGNDDPFSPTHDKPHVHIVIFGKELETNGKNNKRFVLNSVIKKLSPLHYRQGKDEIFFNNGAEVVNMKNKRHYNLIVYNTHETKQAQDDGKYQYDRSECFTNIPDNLLKEIYDYYFTHDNSASSKKQAKVPKMDVQLRYMENARDLGLKGLDFDDWWYNLPIQAQYISGLKHKCFEQYNVGIERYVENLRRDDNFTRCCIFIQGSPNTGKTTTSENTLFNMKLKYLSVSDSGSGKLDDLKPTHQAIIVNDTAIGDLLNMADNRPCKSYRRNSDNPYACNIYLIITSNKTFDDYCKTFYPNDDVEALRTRFTRCIMDKSGLHVMFHSSRGLKNDTRKKQTNLLLNDFLDNFNAEFNKWISDNKEEDEDALAQKETFEKENTFPNNDTGTLFDYLQEFNLKKG